MKTVRLEQAEIEYLLELVAEAWFYNRSIKTLSDEKQRALARALKRISEQ